MEKINSRRNFNKENQSPKYNNININFQRRPEGKSYDNIPSKKPENLNFNTYNISSPKQNSRMINLEKYNNICPVSNPNLKKNKLNFNSKFTLHCPACQCENTYYHVHHFHIPHNYSHICPRLDNLQNTQSNQDLLKEIAELKEECQKFKDELEKTKSENEIGNKYIKLLENKINLKQYNKEDDLDNNINNLENKYHSMLDKSFEVLNSVSNKCDDEKGKLRGNTFSYAQKEPDYDSLIEAQKRWLDNLPEKYNTFSKNNFNNNNYNNNLYNNSTFSNTNDRFGDLDNDNSHYNEKYFNNMRNFNKSADNNINNNINDNLDILNNKKNPNTFPDFNIDDKINNININNNFNNLVESKEPDLEEQIPQDINDLNEQEEEIQEQNNENNINNNQETSDEYNPLNERFLITDEKGNPIIIGGQKLLGMKLIPLIGEDGKEELDDNGNTILIGPDGQPKSQEDLEPILLDDDRPLVNEENRPFLGINGIPLINEYGNPILGPGELYDRNNNVVKGVLGLIEQKDDNINIINEENEGEEEGKENTEDKNDINKNTNNINIDPNKLRPLIGSNGLPVRDSENNFVFLDENNKPVKNTGLYLLLDQNGKPVLNSKSKPILINSEGKPINLVDSDKNDNYINNQLLNKILEPKENDINDININENDKKDIKYIKAKIKKPNKKKQESKGNSRYNEVLMNENENQNLRDKRNKGLFTYSEVDSEEIKKIQFMNNSAEYKGNCFACDVGCSVSRSGYSPMNYVPYNNLIRRREVTPVKNGKKNKNKKSNNIMVNKQDINNENNYYLTEE